MDDDLMGSGSSVMFARPSRGVVHLFASAGGAIGGPAIPCFLRSQYCSIGGAPRVANAGCCTANALCLSAASCLPEGSEATFIGLQIERRAVLSRDEGVCSLVARSSIVVTPAGLTIA